MGLQADHQQEGEQSVLELARPHSGKGWSGVVIGNDQPAPDRDNDSIRARAPAPQVPPGKRRSVEVPPPKKHPQESKPPPTEQDREVGDRSRIARWRRHRGGRGDPSGNSMLCTVTRPIGPGPMSSIPATSSGRLRGRAIVIHISRSEQGAESALDRLSRCGRRWLSSPRF
jgi:hypothetical protein